MGIIVHVYRNTLGDCTNNGDSSWCDKLCVVNVPGPFEPKAGLPPYMLVSGPLNTIRLVPAHWSVQTETWLESKLGFMFGGNFGYTSDSRFGQTVRDITKEESCSAVKIFDRLEYSVKSPPEDDPRDGNFVRKMKGDHFAS